MAYQSQRFRKCNCIRQIFYSYNLQHKRISLWFLFVNSWKVYFSKNYFKQKRTLTYKHPVCSQGNKAGCSHKCTKFQFYFKVADILNFNVHWIAEWLWGQKEIKTYRLKSTVKKAGKVICHFIKLFWNCYLVMYYLVNDINIF